MNKTQLPGKRYGMNKIKKTIKVITMNYKKQKRQQNWIIEEFYLENKRNKIKKKTK